MMARTVTVTPEITKLIEVNAEISEAVINVDAETITAVRTYTENGGDGTPSVTQHTIYFEFSDGTNTTITAYYDDSFISDAITATTPTTYGQKTVTLAQLDGVTWYEKPSETWETLLDGNVNYYPNQNTTEPPYCWIATLADVSIPLNSVWRVTFDNVEYRLTATYYHSGRGVYIIGNPLYVGDSDDGSGVPFAFFNIGYGAWSGAADVQPYSQQTTHSVKIERLVTA